MDTWKQSSCNLLMHNTVLSMLLNCSLAMRSLLQLHMPLVESPLSCVFMRIDMFRPNRAIVIIYICVCVCVYIDDDENTHTRVCVQHPVTCIIQVTITTVYATLFIYPLLEDAFFIATCFGSVEPSSGDIHMILRMQHIVLPP
jgi:hypothetical protein